MEKEIANIENEQNNSGMLPEGVNPKDPESVAKNTKVEKEEIPEVKTGDGVSSSLMQKIAVKLIRGCNANLLLSTQSVNRQLELFKKVLEKHPIVSLTLLDAFTASLNDDTKKKISPLFKEYVGNIVKKYASGGGNESILAITENDKTDYTQKLIKILDDMIKTKKLVESLKYSEHMDDKIGNKFAKELVELKDLLMKLISL